MGAATHQPRPHEIETASGRYIDLLMPRPEQIVLEDIAHGLAHTCRYAGHVRRYFSVAEHACIVADYLEAQGAPPAVVLAGLHHDDTEAYLGDITRPLKALLSAYRVLEARVAAAISLSLSLPLVSSDGAARVKAADDWALSFEAYHLLPSGGRGWPAWGVYDPAGECVRAPSALGLAPDEARDHFLAMHELLADQVGQRTHQQPERGAA